MTDLDSTKTDGIMTAIEARKCSYQSGLDEAARDINKRAKEGFFSAYPSINTWAEKDVLRIIKHLEGKGFVAERDDIKYRLKICWSSDCEQKKTDSGE